MNVRALLLRMKALALVSFTLIFGNALSQDAAPGKWISFPGDISPKTNVMAGRSVSQDLWAGTNAGIFRTTDYGLTWSQVERPIAGKEVISMLWIDNLTVYVGTAQDGLFRSDNGGATWTQALEARAVRALLWLERDQTLYAGLAYAGLSDELGVWKSTDFGKTWEPSGLSNQEISEFHEIDGRLIAIGAYLFYSDNGGSNWAQVDPPNTLTPSKPALLSVDSLLYAATFFAGVWRSGDRGETWVQANPPMDTQWIGTLIYNATNHSLFAGTYDNGVWRSMDSGQNWEQAASPLDSGYVQSLIALDDGTMLAGTADNGVWRSTDGGIKWTQVDPPMNDKSVDIFIQHHGKLYAATEDKGIFRSSDQGKTWYGSGNSFYLRPNAVGVYVEKDFNFILAYGERGIFRSEDGGQSWSSADTLQNRPVRRLVEMDNAFYAGKDLASILDEDARIYKSMDRGITWTPTGRLPSDGLLRVNQVTSLHASAGRLYAGSNLGLFYSGDNGASWSAAISPMNFGAVLNIISLPDGRLIADNNYEKGIFYSDDLGQNWTRANPPMDNQSVTVLLAADATTVYAGTGGNGFFYSTDRGANWAPAPAPMNDKNISTLSILEGGVIYAGTQGNGVWRSTDGGTRWEGANPPMADKTVLSLFRWATEEDTALFAATGAGRGVFRSLDGGRNWTALNTGFNLVNDVRAFKDIPLIKRLYAATDAGVYFQQVDFAPPQAVALQIGTSEGRKLEFTRVPEVTLLLDAEDQDDPPYPDSMIVFEDGKFSEAKWEPFQNLFAFTVSNTDGPKIIHAQVKDLSWNLSATVKDTITLDTTAPRFLAHTVTPVAPAAGQSIRITQEVDDRNPDRIELIYWLSGQARMSRAGFLGNAIDIDGAFVANRGFDYRIVATDKAGNDSTLQNGALDFFSLPVNIAAAALGNSRSLPSGAGGAAYRIVSIPLDLPDSPKAKDVFRDLGNYGRRGNWRFHAYSGNSQWEEGENIQMQTGAGYFMIRRDGGSLTNAIAAATTKTTDGVLGNISGWKLRGGDWTLIGNPYNTRLELSQLKLKRKGTLLSNQGAEVQVWSYDGQWRNPATDPELALESWGGLFIRASAADTIVFANNKEPYARNAAKTGIAATELADGEWSIQITAASGECRDAINYFGVRKEAKDDLDNFDWHEPPFLPDGIGLSFPHPGWNSPAELTADFRGNESDGQRWEISVKGEPSHAVQLGFANIESAPNALQILLVDEITKIVHDLRKEATVAVRIPESGVKSLAILAGSDFFINKNTAGMLAVPTTFALHQNYPNPFNPSTTIRYQLPVAGYVTLKIFDMMGREVLVLEENKSREPGYYEAVADMNALGSGVYFYQIAVAGEQKFQATKKMIFVK
ncbi:T9SS type A sorting domain-containing protein [bacterium]|nr:T9SS type A sorting domain-containing protein [bacterium]